MKSARERAIKPQGRPLRLAARKPTAEDAFRRAVAVWNQGEKLEMAALAEELGVTRVTLFRWVGNREELLLQILGDQWELIWNQALVSTRGSGSGYVAEVCRRVMSAIMHSKGIRSLLVEDPEYALRILTSKTGPVQQRAIESLQGLLLDQASNGDLQLSIEADALAYAIVRLIESFIYSDQISGRRPDIGVPMQILALILRPGHNSEKGDEREQRSPRKPRHRSDRAGSGPRRLRR